MQIVWPLLGGSMLVLLVVDVFMTVYHTEAHGGPLNRRQNYLLWEVFRWVAARLDGGVRPRFLSLAGPLLAVLTPAGWVVLLVVGYALIYYPWIGTFLVSPGHLRAPFAEALYYSGMVAPTLGTGDVVADTVALRILSIVECFSGFALVTAALTYALSVYGELARAITLATEIAARLDGHLDRVPRAADDPFVESWGGWMEDTGRMLRQLRHAYTQYPILHYFRPREEASSLPLQLVRLLELVDVVEASPDRGGASLARHPGLYTLEAGIRIVVGSADRRLLPRRLRLAPERLGHDEVREIQRRVLKYLLYR